MTMNKQETRRENLADKELTPKGWSPMLRDPLTKKQREQKAHSRMRNKMAKASRRRNRVD